MSADTPQSLWHYTDAAGLLGILNSSALWATDARFLNDTEEVSLAAAIIERTTGDFLKGKPSDAQGQGRVAQMYRVMFEELCGSEGPSVKLPEKGPYVASFCERKDLLSQWRGYGGSGVGFAIEFSLSALTEAAEAVGGTLLRCEYVDASFDLPGLGLAGTLSGGNGEARLAPDYETLARYKHKAFEEEEEWRMILPSKESVATRKYLAPIEKEQFRTGSLGLIPYVQVTIESLPNAIRSVCVGPSGSTSPQLSAVSRLLASHDITAEVFASTAPYRSVR